MSKHEDIPYIFHILEAVSDIGESVKGIEKQEKNKEGIKEVLKF